MVELLEADMKKSGIVPPALKNRPRLDSHLIRYIDAYNSLRCHRTRSEAGHNPIGYSDLVLYAQTHGFMSCPDVFETFEVLVQSCDHAFLGFAEEKQRQAFAKMKAKTKS